MIFFSKPIGVLTVFSLLFSIHAFAEVNATLQLPADGCLVGESCEISVLVEGSRSAEEPQIQVPPGLELSYRGAATSMSYISGQGSNSSMTFTYELLASRAGQFVIGPAIVNIDGSVFEIQARTLRVLENGAAKTEDRYFFVEATATPNAAYTGQQVVYSFRFYNRARINNAEYKAPSFDKFWKEDMGKQKEYRQERDGFQWDVVEINYALFPTSSGELVVDSAELTVNAIVQSRRQNHSIFGDFMGGEIKKIKLATKPTLIKVINLPPIPAGFEKTALIGNFNAQASLSKSEGKVGDSITLTVVLEGTGNIWDSKLVNIDMPQIKAYADKPTLATKLDANGLQGRRVFKFALVPKQAGTISIAPISFSYFDPKENAYKKASTQALTIEVSPADEEDKITHVKATNTAAAKNEIQVLGTDLMPPHWGELSQDALGEQESLILWLILGLCPFAYLAAFAWRRRLNVITSDPNYIRGKKALSELRAKVKALEKSPRFYEEIATAMRVYVTHRLGLEAQGMTSADVERILGPKGLSRDAIDLAKHLILESERGQYGGHQGNSNHKSELIEKLKLFSNQVEKEC